MFLICLECCVDLICSVVVLIVHVWAVVVMFQTILHCVQPTGSTNAECIVTASQETWSSLPAEPSLQSVSNSRWSLHLVSSSLSVQHRVRGCAKKKPTSTSTSATICIKTSFTIVQGCSTSSTNNDGESFEKRKRVFAKYARSARALCPMTTCFQRQMS